MTLRAAILALCALSLVACGDDDVGDMPIIMIDAGRDMNTPPPVDMFVPRDMNVRTCGARQTTLPESVLPRCSAATNACVAACTTQACATACLEADTTPPATLMGQSISCAVCTSAQIIGCSANSTCGGQWDALVCCAVDNCAGRLDNACIMGDCSAAFSAFSTCAGAASCNDDVAACFATADIDGGVLDTDGGTPVDGGDTDGGTPTSDAGTDAGPTTPTP